MFRAQIAVAFADAALSHSPGDERGVLLLKRLAVGFYGLEGRSGNRAIDEWPGGAEIFSKISGDRLRRAVNRRFVGRRVAREKRQVLLRSRSNTPNQPHRDAITR